MKSYTNRFFVKLAIRSVACLAALVIFADAIANDGKPSTVTLKGSTPVNEYQAFMIALAIIYGVYLFVRARRRKRNGKITD